MRSNVPCAPFTNSLERSKLYIIIFLPYEYSVLRACRVREQKLSSATFQVKVTFEITLSCFVLSFLSSEYLTTSCFCISTYQSKHNEICYSHHHAVITGSGNLVHSLMTHHQNRVTIRPLIQWPYPAGPKVVALSKPVMVLILKNSDCCGMLWVHNLYMAVTFITAFQLSAR